MFAFVVGVYFTVQAASSRANLSGERVVTMAGLLPDTSHVRSAWSSATQQNFSTFYEGSYQDEGRHGCDRESPGD
ncbi:MAG: hypothetical protein IT314_16655 [Anaerolineales bacterium]|nr:hypothetical protein [Anaerolineales bacterium]